MNAAEALQERLSQAHYDGRIQSHNHVLCPCGAGKQQTFEYYKQFIKCVFKFWDGILWFDQDFSEM